MKQVRRVARRRAEIVEDAIERCERPIYYLAYPQPGAWQTTEGEVVAWLVHEPGDEDRTIEDMDATPVTWSWDEK